MKFLCNTTPSAIYGLLFLLWMGLFIDASENKTWAEKVKMNNKKRYGNDDDHRNVKNQTSIFNGVSWKKKVKKWQAKLQWNQKQYSGGNYDTQENAAMGVNFL
jgi:hypothetical protein